MKLYWGPHTCAIGIHILLEEAGAHYEIEEIDVAGGGTHSEAFLAINPKGKVPTLVRDDGSVLTEFGAIGTWLARTYPEAGLIPKDAEAEARHTEILEYVEGTVHGQGFARLFAPQMFEPQDVLHGTLGVGRGKVEQQGREMIEQAFAILDRQLGHGGVSTNGRITVADAALFYVERWAPQHELALPPNLDAHYRAMLARPAVQKVRKLWHEA